MKSANRISISPNDFVTQSQCPEFTIIKQSLQISNWKIQDFCSLSRKPLGQLFDEDKYLSVFAYLEKFFSSCLRSHH